MFSDWWTMWASLVLGALVLAAFWWRHYSTKLSHRDLPKAPLMHFIGNMLQMALNKKPFHIIITEMYNKLDQHPYAGISWYTSPLVLIRDPEIIRAITVKHFDHFTDHIGLDSSNDPLLKRLLLTLKGKQWHDMRATLSPAFTSMKMKNMFALMTEIGQQMVDYLAMKSTVCEEDSSSVGSTLTLEMMDFFTRLSNDIIATTAFGIKVDSLSDPNNTFFVMGRNLTTVNRLVGMGYMISTKLMELLNIPLIDQKTVAFFKSIVLNTIKTREKQGIVRHDMIHLLMQARREELASQEADKNEIFEGKGTRLTDDDIAAQALQFFFAGFGTIATLMTFCSYLLANNEDVQRRLQQEIDDVMQKSGGRPSYEQVMGCQYLDMVISESLRMYTPASALDRKCVCAYKLPATESYPGFMLQPGDGIWIPVYSIHHDPKYYEEPDRFNPERFSPQNKHLIKPFTYYPFGSGPRMCIAQRFALMEAKVVMTYLLSRFSFQVIEKTPVPPVIVPFNLSFAIKGGAWLGIRSRSSTLQSVL